MDFTVIINIISLFSVLISIYSVWAIVRLIKRNRMSKKHNETLLHGNDDEYSRIVANTHRIESSRQPNTGIHYDDESIYIERGKIIKDKTVFFKLVNHL